MTLPATMVQPAAEEKAMRILTALTYYRPHYSGLTIYTERVALGLAQRGHQVTILTSRFDPNLPRREVRDGLQVIRPRVWLRLSKGVIMPSLPYRAWQLARQADIIHLHVPQLDAAPIAILARLLGKPVVLTYHCDLRLPDGFVHHLANVASDAANAIALRLAHAIVTNTRDYAEHSSHLKPYLPKLAAIYPPVEVAPVSPEQRQAFRPKYRLQPGDRLIGMVSRLATEKGVEYLAQALPMVLKRFPQARVLFVGPYQNVVGEEPYARRLEPTLQRLGDHWKFLGILSDEELGAFYQECEVLALPSLNSTESFGIVQVEAMACGTPVVATDLPGVRIPVQRTDMGIIVPTANSEALAQALVEILSEPGKFRGKPEAIVPQSRVDTVAETYERLFQYLLNHPANNRELPAELFTANLENPS